MTKKFFGFVLTAILMLSLFAPAASATTTEGTDQTTGNTESTTSVEETEQSSEDPERTIYISTAEQLQQFAIDCKLDSYSVGLTAYLNADIDMTGIPFDPIGSFSGHFYGRGFTISGLTLGSDGSYQGMFRYIQKDGIVSNVTLSGTISPENLQTNVGGIAGYNYGKILNCTFDGTVNGLENVGGIVGSNMGTVSKCTTSGYVSGKTATGGIVGSNSGTIRDCTNYSFVNISVRETETSVETLNILDLSNIGLITSSSSDTVSDSGGIAGYSDGTIRGCENKGDIGYTTYGYNVGGICGRQSYYVADCTNYGTVLGRQDVGGIVGQMEPYLLKTQVESLIDELQALTDSMNAAMGDLSANSGEARGVMQEISADAGTAASSAYTMDQNSDDPVLPSEDDSSSDDEEDSGVDWEAVGQKTQDAADYTSGVADSIGSDTMQDVVNGDLTDQDISTLETVGGGVAEDGATAASSKIDDLKAQKQAEKEEEEAQDAAYQAAYAELNSSISSMSSGLVKLNNMLADSLGDLASDMSGVNGHFNRVTKLMANLLGGETDVVSDISKYDTESLSHGKVTGCINYGAVDGESNIGGIGGNMSVENEYDLEGVLSSGAASLEIVRNTYEERCVTRSCINYGDITGKKSNIGGIVGTEEIGAIFGCESYGSVEAEDANYVGGIAGHSDSYITTSYAMCDLMGNSYVGGIAGYGLQITSCSTLIKLLNTPASCGAIAGYADETLTGEEEEGNADTAYYYIYGNTFVHDTLGAIDNLSYAEQAYPVSYVSLISREDVPAAFRTLTLTFIADGETVAVVPFIYGESVDTTKIPEVPKKEGYSGYWPEYNYDNLTFSDTIEAQYVTDESTIATLQTRNGSNQSLVLLEGIFSADTVLNAEPYTGAPPVLSENETIQEMWNVTLLGNKTDTDNYRVRYLKPASKVNSSLQIYVLDPTTGEWNKAETSVRGSYLTFDAVGGDSVVFCAVSVRHFPVLAVVVAVIVIALICGFFLLKKQILGMPHMPKMRKSGGTHTKPAKDKTGE